MPAAHMSTAWPLYDLVAAVEVREREREEEREEGRKRCDRV